MASSLQTFPCDFPLKVFGIATNEFEASIRQLIEKHVDDLPQDAIQYRLSENGRYSALSITVPVNSQQQLDDIYRELSSSPLVLMVL